MRWLCVVGLLLAAASSQAAELPSIEEAFKPLLKDKPTAALVVGVLQDGKTHYLGLGEVTTPVGTSTPNERTLFEIGSITKTFTGVLLADAIQRNEVQLADDANKHLPAHWQIKPKSDKPVTLQHLATHRSGLPVEPPLLGLMAKNPANPFADFTPARLTKLMEKLQPTKEPEEKYTYSNLGFGLLGHALVHAAQAPSYESLVRDRITAPLKMYDTGAALTGEQKARLAKPQTQDGEATDPWDFATLEACGALRSTAADMLLYAGANLSAADTPLHKAMRHSHQQLNDTGNSYVGIGLGWHLFVKEGQPTIVWHNGGTGGYRSMLVLQPEANAAVVVLSVGVKGRDLDQAALSYLAASTKPKK